MTWIEGLGFVFSVILGGGWLINVLTIKSQRIKAGAEAKGADAIAEGSELDNVTKAIAIWRESAEASESRYKTLLENYSQLAIKVGDLESTVKQLTATNKQIIKILNSINHDNLEQKKQEAKEITG